MATETDRVSRCIYVGRSCRDAIDSDYVQIRFGDHSTVVALAIEPSCPVGHVQLSSLLRQQLTVPLFHSIEIRAIAPLKASLPDSLGIHYVRWHGSDNMTTCSHDMRSDAGVSPLSSDGAESVVVDRGALLHNVNGDVVAVRVSEPIRIRSTDLPSLKLIPCADLWLTPLQDGLMSRVQIGGYEKVRKELKQHVKWPLEGSGRFGSGVCVTGVPGSGRTDIVKALVEELALNRRTSAANSWITCADMASDKVCTLLSYMVSDT